MESVVLLTVDCLRRDHVGCYGYDRPTTPNVDAVAKSASVFDGYANCPGTRWTFQTLHTGVYTPRIDNLGIPDDYKPLAEYFREAGYATAGFVDNGWVNRDWGYDRGFDEFYSVQETREQAPLVKRIGQHINDRVGENVRDKVLSPLYDRWLDSQRADGAFRPPHTDADTVDQVENWVEDRSEPYFLWVHFMDAHTPYGYWPEQLRAVRGDTEIEHTVHPGKEGLISIGEEPPQRVIDTYDAGIRYVDEQIGRVLDAVDDQSSVVITGDHGEEFGRFDQFHEASLHYTHTDVPLIIEDEAVHSAERGAVATHIDIPPTLLAMADVEAPDHWDGVALQSTPRTTDEPVYFALDGERAVQYDGWKLIREADEAELLKKTANGETEQSTDDGPTEQLRRLLDEFSEMLQPIGDGYERSDMNQETEENLKDLGYL